MAGGQADMTDEQAFAWMRRRAPSAATLTVWEGMLDDVTIVRAEDATDDDLDRLRTSLGLICPWKRWRVVP